MSKKEIIKELRNISGGDFTMNTQEALSEAIEIVQLYEGKSKRTKTHICRLYWDNDPDAQAIVEINTTPNKFAKLVKEYIKADEEEYNVDDFIEFLSQKGYRARGITPEEDFYF